MRQLLGWIVFGALVAYPAWYLAANWNDYDFRQAVVGNWFATILGVIAGVPVAIRLAQLQQRAQDRAETAKRLLDRDEQLRKLKNQLLDELQFNIDAVGQLHDVLEKAPDASDELWTWARQLVESFEFFARRDFDQFVLTPGERATYASVDNAYRDLRRFASRVRQASVAHSSFLYGYASDEVSPDNFLFEARARADVVTNALRSAIECLKE